MQHSLVLGIPACALSATALPLFEMGALLPLALGRFPTPRLIWAVAISAGDEHIPVGHLYILNPLRLNQASIGEGCGIRIACGVLL